MRWKWTAMLGFLIVVLAACDGRVWEPEGSHSRAGRDDTGAHGGDADGSVGGVDAGGDAGVDASGGGPSDEPVGPPATGGPPTESPLLFHSSFDGAETIFAPEVHRRLYDPEAGALPGPAHVTFEPGHVGRCARIDAAGFETTRAWPIDGPVRFHGANFDFADPDSDGGRLDFWIRFDVDPHTTTANTWLLRTNWNDPERGNGDRLINFEMAGNAGEHATLMVDVYSRVAHSERTNYGTFRVRPRNWSVYEAIRAGEWHRFTLTWRRNGGDHRAELHFYIDGTQDGCYECNDYNGNLPSEGAITDLLLSPELDGYVPFSIDEIHSFDRWGPEADAIAGPLERARGVTITYPQDGRGAYAGVWASPVPASAEPMVFEFNPWAGTGESLTCELVLDGERRGSVATDSGAHAEVSVPSVAPGAHVVEVDCGDGLRSAPTHFCYGGPCSL